MATVLPLAVSGGLEKTDFRLTTKFNKMQETNNLPQNAPLQQTAVMGSVTISEKIAREILIHFNIGLTYKNIQFVTEKIEEYRGGHKREKIISFDAKGNQVGYFDSISEMAVKEGIKYKTASNIIATKGICRKTGLRYRKLSDFGNLKQCL